MKAAKLRSLAADLTAQIEQAHATGVANWPAIAGAREQLRAINDVLLPAAIVADAKYVTAKALSDAHSAAEDKLRTEAIALAFEAQAAGGKADAVAYDRKWAATDPDGWARALGEARAAFQEARDRATAKGAEIEQLRKDYRANTRAALEASHG